MNYPIWELDTIGGGSLIAFIAVLHVYIAHLAVGGGFFIWWNDRRAAKDEDPALLDYVRSHTRFFLLLTMVFGGVSGVGIWFIIALVQPAATSLLIHTFVFAWGIEWVFFLVEILALLVYRYRFDQLDERTRGRVALVYALAAWLSMVVINGILAFMLTPGEWVHSHDFWDGFLNPSYLPSLAFRTMMALMIAGLFGTVTSLRLTDEALRLKMTRLSMRWLLFPMLGAALSAWWYWQAVPESIRARLVERNPEVLPFLTIFGLGSLALVALGAFLYLRLPRRVQQVSAGLAILVGLAWFGAFEYTREIARKPWVVTEVMSACSVRPAEVAGIKAAGLLASARWSSTKTAEGPGAELAGRELFNLSCLPCHTRAGVYNTIEDHTKHLPALGVEGTLMGMGSADDYMPPFLGSAAERRVLAAYIAEELNGQPKPAPLEAPPPAPETTAAPAPMDDEAEFVLLAWNDRGMHLVSDSDAWFVMQPPSATLQAQLIRRGETPEVIHDDVTLRYRVEKGHETPAKESRFWDFFGRQLEANVGLTGYGLAGELPWEDQAQVFQASKIPVMPYRGDGGYQPYPLFTIEAFDAEGARLASTQVVAPVSTELGCKNCHGGPWRRGAAGISDETAAEILRLHDRDNDTTLYEQALAGHPSLCQSCHADAGLGATGSPGRVSLSAAIHAWHAPLMPRQGSAACVTCHPADPRGATRSMRGLHASAGIGCTRCHGDLDTLAASLVLGEGDKVAVGRLLPLLRPQQGASLDEVTPRRAWIQQPDCEGCHENFEAPAGPKVTAFNVYTEDAKGLYRNRRDETEQLRCVACHGAAHALYPAKNPLDRHRDNLQPLHLQGEPTPIGANGHCAVCHVDEMEDSPHHPNMERPFRNKKLYQNHD